MIDLDFILSVLLAFNGGLLILNAIKGSGVGVVASAVGVGACIIGLSV